MIKNIGLFILLQFGLLCCTEAQNKPAFTIIPLGVRGGLDESNLSAYLVAADTSREFLCLDAGTLYSGLEKAEVNKLFNKAPTKVLRENIKGYCISHPHLDHVSGLIINSPADTAKPIYGTGYCLQRIEQHYFSWQTWANFGDAGEQPLLKKYHYQPLQPGIETATPAAKLSVTAYPLSHGAPYESTAFLVRSGSHYLLYLGDTGADSIENSRRLQELWQAVAPLIINHTLKGIFIEVSYPNEQPAKQLFGHLTPFLLMQEMKQLSSVSNLGALQQVPLIITHMKPEEDNETRIKNQLTQNNALHLKLIFPQQGRKFEL